MALPLIPFTAGLAVGSLATYGAKDKALQHKVIEGGKQTYAKIAAASAGALGKTSQLSREVVDQVGSGVGNVPALGKQALDGTRSALGKLPGLGQQALDGTRDALGKLPGLGKKAIKD